MLHPNFARQIHLRRKELGLSLRDVSQASGIAASTISRIENGRYSPTLDNAVRLAAALGMRTSEPSETSITVKPVAALTSEQAPTPTTPRSIVEHKRIAVTILRPGIRRNLSKIAARNNYDTALLLKGTIQLRTNDGFRENLKPGAAINCILIAQHTFFAVAAEEAELLWIG